MTGMELPLAWQPEGTGLQVLGGMHGLCFLPHSQLPMSPAPWQSVLCGVALLLAPGTLGPRLAWENAVLEHAWVPSTLPCPPWLV